MKIFVCYALCLLTFFSCIAQSDKKFVVLLNEKTDEEKITIPFSAIKIIDARFDRTNVGCVALDIYFLATSQYKELAVFPDSLHIYLPKVLSNLLVLEPGGDTLAILVKEFRITDKMYNEISWSIEPSSLLNISASFYALKDKNYYKIFSMDDILIQSWQYISNRVSRKTIPPLRSEALTALIRKLFERRSWQYKQVSFQASEVNEGIQKRFSLPVFSDTAMKGLYRSFNEFKNNRPSVTNIKSHDISRGIIKVEDLQNHPVELNDYWGFCDGKKKYIVFRNRLFELQRIDNSYRFVSYRFLQDVHKSPDFGSTGPQVGLIPAALGSGNTKATEYFYLNMDKGEIYLEEVFGKSSLKSMYKEILK
jgi:hypothetical protein